MSETSRTIVVTGATGRQGGAVAKHLLKRGSAVRALVRSPDKPAAQRLATAGAEVVPGDFDDPASLDRALHGAYGVFSVQDFYAAGYDGEIRQGKAVADGAKAAGVQHFVYSSVGSAHRNTGIPHFESKWEIEQHVVGSGLSHTVLRPAFFYYNYERMREVILGGMLPQPLSPAKPLQQISEEDYGRMVAMVFENRDTYLGRAIDMASSELTMQQVAEIFSHVLGRAIQYQQVPWDQFERQAGAELARMYRWFEDVGYGADLAALRREFGELTALEPYLCEHGWDTMSA